eukprot:9076126-Prorocentrum_lima.AAC.1
MTSSLVGSEMCIRDRSRLFECPRGTRASQYGIAEESIVHAKLSYCLLYTSDAADECRSRWS